MRRDRSRRFCLRKFVQRDKPDAVVFDVDVLDLFIIGHAHLHGMRAILFLTGVLILLHGILRPRFFRFSHRGGCTIREMKAGFGEGTPQQGSDRKGPILRNRKIWATGRYLL